MIGETESLEFRIRDAQSRPLLRGEIDRIIISQDQAITLFVKSLTGLHHLDYRLKRIGWMGMLYLDDPRQLEMVLEQTSTLPMNDTIDTRQQTDRWLEASRLDLSPRFDLWFARRRYHRDPEIYMLRTAVDIKPGTEPCRVREFYQPLVVSLNGALAQAITCD